MTGGVMTGANRNSQSSNRSEQLDGGLFEILFQFLGEFLLQFLFEAIAGVRMPILLSLPLSRSEKTISG